ncbi:MAG TPA: DEAD/DEAH box helicase [Myxococcota bacterium]|nr:DEAD/DEAH box helicase [Myxococcota bacterium]
MADVRDFARAIEAERELAEVLAHIETLPGAAPEFEPALPASFEPLEPLLAGQQIRELYSHQGRALRLFERGSHFVLSTPTASGKTLVYNFAALQRAIANPDSRALYLFPLKALEWDQRRRLERDVADLGAAAAHVRVAVYDGDTSDRDRRRIRESPPQVLITTPDMLHAGILPHHANWRAFFERLEVVAIDELHIYRGVFGSHVAQLLRRLDRIARFHGARPQFVAASATVANPGELAMQLTGHAFEVVTASGAPRAERQILFFRPSGSPYSLAARLFRLAVGLGLRTIAFTKARVITELIHQWVLEAEPQLAAKISSYRAGFLPSERRDIERRLFAGELRGVISTSALELGIDVGGLDVCLLVGYPGSQVATWQRAGRVGRRGRAAIALIAQPDALDQYLVSHPYELTRRGFEHAVVDPSNDEVAAAHLPCAASELPLRADEPWLREPSMRGRIEQLEQQGRLLRSETGTEWFSARLRPHRDVSLRQIGASYAICAERSDGGAPEMVGTIGSANVFSECHEGAIYLHHGRQFLVTRLDLDERAVSVRAVSSAYYTRALSEKQTEILSRERSRPAGNFLVVQGRVRVTKTVTGFERRRIRGQELLGSEPLDLPPTSFETVGIWLEFPDEIAQALETASRHVMGGIHASEHAALSLFPLFALCDRHDVAGISYTRHPQTGRAAIFFYDAQPGGVGLAASMFGRVEALLDATCDLIADCACDDGCPACVHSPKCGSGNRPIDKTASILALRLLLGRDPLPAQRAPARIEIADAEPAQPTAHAAPTAAPRIVYFDLETQRSAEEVGGWHNAPLMRVALAVLFDSRNEQYETFFERDVPRLIDRLAAADLIVGFNVLDFDYAVLRGYTDRELRVLPTFDMLAAIHERLGYRLSLGHLAEETLGASKRGDGLQALSWWKQGRIDEIERYCRQDVSLLVELMRHAGDHGHLWFRTKRGDRVRLPATWPIPELIERARAQRVDATRAAQRARAGSPSRGVRRADATAARVPPRASG